MMEKRTNLSFLFLLAFILLCPSTKTCLADEIALGNEAKKAGKLKQALSHYTMALKANKGHQQQLREKIIKLALEMDSLPAVPESYYKHMARGEVFVESAQDKNGYSRAAGEFFKASNHAPWRSEVYYNLGIVQDKAGLYDNAMQSLNLYLLAAPNASDAREVRTLIYKIEARKEAQQSKSVAAVKTKPKYPKPSDLEGEWWGTGAWKGGNKGEKFWISAIGSEIEMDFSPYQRFKCGRPCLTLYLKGNDLIGSQRTYGGYFTKPLNAKIGCSTSKVDYNLKINGSISKDLQTITLWWKQLFLTYGCRKIYEDYKFILRR